MLPAPFVSFNGVSTVYDDLKCTFDVNFVNIRLAVWTLELKVCKKRCFILLYKNSKWMYERSPYFLYTMMYVRK